MKKKWLVILLILLTGTMLFASVTDRNSQKIHSIDSPVYKAILNLYIEQGLALPSTTGPWSEAELELMVSRLDPDDLGPDARATYDWIYSEISEEPKIANDMMGMNVGLYTDSNIRAHSNPKDFSNPDMWGGKGDWYMESPFLRVPIEAWMGPSAYAYFNLDLLQNPRRMRFDKGHSAEDMYFASSIPALTPYTTENWDICWDFPYRAFGAVGGSWWNLAVGRDKLSWGPGVTGNFAIGDQLPYHENARFSMFTDNLKYTCSLSSFCHPKNYFSADGTKIDLSYDQSNKKEGLKLFIGHRLEWRIADKVNMALTESIVYQNETGAIDLSVLNPLMLLHNLYIRSNSNSLLTFEMDYTPTRHLNIYGQLAVDEFNVPGEHAESGPPMAMAGMLGAKTSFALGNGMIYGNIEGAYTDPYLYLRDDGSMDNSRYGVDFLTAIPVFSGINGFTVHPIGYRYSGDAIVGEAKVGYEEFGKWNAEAEFTFIAHGCFDLYTKWQKVSNGDAFHGPTDKHPDGTYNPSSHPENKNAVSYTSILSLKGGYTILRNLDVYGQLDYVNIQNVGNIKGVKADDVQFTLGLKYSL